MYSKSPLTSDLRLKDNQSICDSKDLAHFLYWEVSITHLQVLLALLLMMQGIHPLSFAAFSSTSSLCQNGQNCSSGTGRMRSGLCYSPQRQQIRSYTQRLSGRGIHLSSSCPSREFGKFSHAAPAGRSAPGTGQ